MTSQTNRLSQIETICGSLLHELQTIWDEIGESDAERDKMLIELQQECLQVCKIKVDQANMCRVKLKQAIAEAETELASICSAMGELPVHIRQSDLSHESLKSELCAILPEVEEMRKRKVDRKNQFTQVLNEIRIIENEIYRSHGFASNETAIDEVDLSMRKLEELHRKLQGLRKEKSERLKLVHDSLSCLYSLCTVLGLDFKKIVSEIHPSLGEAEGSKNISNGTIDHLETAIKQLRQIKVQRMQELQDHAASLLELWHLMDTPPEEQQAFQKVTCKLAASEDEIREPDMLSIDHINYARAEVLRLEDLKASKMNELVLKKKAELELICRKTRLIPDSDNAMEVAIDAIESGAVDAAYVLEQIELQIAKVKEESLSRKEILEKVEKWMAACEEESWLEEYNRDDNRYNAGRGAHLALKRAEKARVLVNKLPAMVDGLASKVTVWEKEEGKEFSYNGVRLLSMLETYVDLREQKEMERKRQRDHKKLQGQLLAEQEALYGAKPSPKKNLSAKKESRPSSCNSASKRKLSLGAPMLQTPKRDSRTSAKVTPNTQKAKTNDGFSALSSGRKVSDVRLKHSPINREPFTPISTRTPPKKTNTFKDLNKKTNGTTLQTPVVSKNNLFSTPLKTTISSGGQENRTPKTGYVHNPFSTPPKTTISSGGQENRTPKTAYVPMQTTLTPPVPIQTAEEGIEYSFEEKRAGFVLPISHIQWL